jgi:hypothetical protein
MRFAQGSQDTELVPIRFHDLFVDAEASFRRAILFVFSAHQKF